MDEEHTASHIVPFEHPFVEHYPDGLENYFHHPDEEFNEDVHHHNHTGRPHEDILHHHHHHTLPWWADGTNWTISSDEESEPPTDYDKLESTDRPQSHATCFSVIGLLVLALLGGGVALLIFLLPPYPDDRPKGCVHFPPRFGLNCEFRCHCFNLSEVCDKLTGHCESGCMSGWRGEDCQIIYSIFNKPSINAKSQSKHTVTCSIFKLWYNISTVNITVYNGTDTHLKIEVPYLETVSTSDPRLNARISKTSRIEEADNITFSFEFREDDCDLEGLYECQFDMVEQFNTSFANLSVLVQDSSHGLQIETKTEYVEGSMDNITCSLQLANPTSTVELIFIDSKNKTRNSTTFVVNKEVISSDAKCTNLTYFVYQFKAIKELNGSIAKCSLVDDLSGETMGSDGSPINVITGIINVQTVLEPKHQVAFLGSTAEMFCHANSSNLKWNVIHLNFMNSSSSQRLISIYHNKTVQMNTYIINATIINNDDNLNISYILYIDKDEMVCLLDGEYYCDVEFIDYSVQTNNQRGTLEVATQPSVTEFLVKDIFYSKSNHSFSCRATFDDNANGTIEIQICSEISYKPITDDPAFALKETIDEDFPGICTSPKSVVYNFNFTQASNGTRLRCLATDHNRNMSATTECLPLVLQPPVLVKMLPTVLYARIGTTATLMCSIQYRGYAWSAINIVQQNTTDSVLLLNVSSDEKVETKNSRISASVNRDDKNINVTVSFDVSPGSDVCELNQTYTCDIQLIDASIGTIAAATLFVIEIPVADVHLHIEPEYQYGSYDWINCTVNAIEKSAASMYLEVCLNETTHISISNFTKSETINDVSVTRNENCSLGRKQGYRFLFNKYMNISLRCRVEDHYFKTSLETACNRPYITPALVQIMLEPKNQIVFLGGIAEMFCNANVSTFEWKVIHLYYQNSSSLQRLVSVYYNGTAYTFSNMIETAIVQKDKIVNISYVFNINDANVCSLDGEYSCNIEFLDDAIQTIIHSGNLTGKAGPNITMFLVQDHYNSDSNHSLSCTATYGSDSSIHLQMQLCRNNTFYPLDIDPAFEWNQSSDIDTTGTCTRQKFVEYTFNFTQASHGTLLRCIAFDSLLGINTTTKCLPLVLHPPAIAEMTPRVLHARLGNTSELKCSILYRGYVWSSVNILQQNTTGSVLLLNVSSDGKVESKNARINGSMISNNDYINVTVSFDVSPGKGVCELNQTYSCDIRLMDSSIGTTAANSVLLLEVPVTDVRIHLQPEYQYGTLNWINCTANTIDGSTAAVSLEVCHNETTFIPIKNITTSMPIEDGSMSKNENCSVQKILSHSLVFNKQMNVSFRCRVDADYNEAPLTSNCIMPNISPASVQIILEPENQSALLGSTTEMFCQANASIFKWKVIHLDFRNTSSSKRLISVYYNESQQGLEDVINATLISKAGIVFISYVFNISDNEMVCFLDGEYSCDLEFLDDEIQKTYVKGFLVVSAPPKVTDFVVQNDYNSESNHSFSCTATFDDNANISLEIQLCKDNSFQLITEDSAFALSASSDQEITGMCTHQKSVVYYFNFTQASTGSLLRCLATDHNLNISATTECLPLVLKPPVFAEMIPTVLYARIDSTTELMCSIYYRGYAWSTINILQQNTTGSVLLLNVSSDGKVESKNARINGSMISNNDYINVTVSVDVSPGTGVCELNQTYSCDIQLMDSSIGTTAANSTLVLEIPVTNVRIHLQPEYQYGTLNWINCTANTIHGSIATLSLEVCHNKTTFIPIENITISMPIEDVSLTKNENCSVQKMLSHNLVFNKQMNVSFRCRIDADYNKAPLTSNCIMPNISPASVEIILEPNNQSALLGSTAEMFCKANASIFQWKVIHLDFRNTSSAQRLISVYYNETKQGLENVINATLISKDGIVNISYVFKISDDEMVCFLDGEYSCDLEFLDDAIQKTYVNGLLVISARPTVTDFMIQNFYNSESNHSFSCTATFDDNADISLEIQLCKDNSFKSITENSAFGLSASSDQEITGKCTHQKSVVYYFNFTQASNGTRLRCLATDHNLNRSATTECLSLVLKPPVFSYLEPKRQIGLPNTTVEVFCYANISNYEWEAVHLLYLNDSASQRMISVYQNETNTVIEKSITATIVNRDEIVNISFFISIKEQNSMCVKFSELACNFEFSDKDIETAYEKGTIEIIAPPSNLSVESLGDGYEYGYRLDETINCTAIMNPNTTTLSLIAKKSGNVDEYNFAPKINITTFVEPNAESGCYPTVRVVYHFIYPDFLKDTNNNDNLGCLANDTISGQLYISEFRSVLMLYIT